MMKPYTPLLLLLILLGGNTTLKAQNNEIRDHWWQPNGTVEDVLFDSTQNVVYVAGSFDALLPNESYGTKIDKNGVPLFGFANANGPVWVSEPDGEGGYFIGGEFSQVGDSIRSNIAHINASGFVTSKIGSKGFNNKVLALELAGDTLYVGGEFNAFGEFNSFGSVVNSSSGVLKNSHLEIDGVIRVSVSDGNGGWYFGGEFNRVNDKIRRGLAHINALGQVSDWNPSCNSQVYSMAISGDTIFVGGKFTSIGGEARNNLAAIDTLQGNVFNWAPNPDSTVYAILPIGGRIYVGGEFLNIQGLARNRLGAVDQSGNVLAWNPNVNGVVRALGNVGSSIYVGGVFSHIGSSARGCLAKLDTNGTLGAWNPNCTGSIYSLKVDGNNVYVGGQFYQIGTHYLDNAAKINATTGGVITAWNPSPSGSVWCVNKVGIHIALAGSFGSLSGNFRQGVGMVSSTTGMATSWNPNILAQPWGDVYTVQEAGSFMFIGGKFKQIGVGVRRNSVAAINLSSQTLLSFQPVVNGRVNCLFRKGNDLFIGGGFINVGNSNPPYLMKVNATTGNSFAWNASVNYEVLAMDNYLGTLIIGGGFTSVGAQTRRYLAAINMSNAQLLSNNWLVNNAVNDLEVRGNDLFIGGSFTTVLNTNRNKLAQINLSNGTLSLWNPNVDGVVYGLSVSESEVIVGGQFIGVGIEPRDNIASVSISTGLATGWNPRTNGTVYSVSHWGENTYAGGDFSSIGLVSRNNVCAFNANTGVPNSWNPNPNGMVIKLAKYGSSIFLGGAFTQVGNGNSNNLAKVNATSGALQTMPSTNGIVRDLIVNSNMLYVAGDFTKVGTVFRRGIASFQLSNNNLSAWNPLNSSFNQVYAMAIHGSNIFMAGNFHTVNGVSRNYLAKVNKSTGLVDAWNPNPDDFPRDLLAVDSTLFVGGRFSQIHGNSRGYGASYNLNTDSLTSWNPDFNGFMDEFYSNDSILLVGGRFTSSQNDVVVGLSAFHNNSGVLTDFRTGISKGGYGVGAIDQSSTKTFLGGSMLFNGRRGVLKIASIDPPCIATFSHDTIVACDSYVWLNGETYTSSNSTAKYRLINQNGCDSIVSLHLTILYSSSYVDTITACDSYTWIDGNSYYFSNTSAIHVLTNNVGCDSIVTLHLTIPNTRRDTVVACEQYTWTNGITYTSNNFTEKDTIFNSNGCDTIKTLHLTVLQSSANTETITACHEYTWRDGVTYTQNNSTAKDTIMNSVGCDSVISLDLTIFPRVYATDTIEACGPYTWIDGNTYTTNNNTAVDTLITSSGCDSVVTLFLKMGAPNWFIDTIYSCTSYTWIDGVVYDSSNFTATHTLMNSSGCDSIVSLHLTINKQYGIDTVSACLYYTWVNGQTYFSNNNTATYSTLSSTGCDSITTLNLTISQNTIGIDTITSCDPIVWIDGNTYSVNNTSATHTIYGGNSGGCDSIVILDFTLLSSPVTTLYVTACDSFTWNGITYTASTNTPLDTLVNVAGCDSIVNLHLTISYPSFGVDVITACDSLTWINGITYYSSNNTAKDTLMNASGCDSIVTLDLTLTSSSTATVYLADCDSLTWINGETYYNDTTVTYVIANSLGCDSVITLQATIPHSTAAIDSVIAVNQYTWIDGVTYYAHNSSATHTLSNAAGCDSIVSLYLEIQVVEIGIDIVGSSLIATADSGTFQWVECPGYTLIPGATDSVFNPTQNGSYAVIVTQNGYTDTSDCITVSNVGIVDVSLSNNIRVYPNPVQDQVHIEITNWPAKMAKIVVRDVTGKQVYDQEIEPISNQETISINTAKWAKGTYFIEVGEGPNKVVKQMVVQ